MARLAKKNRICIANTFYQHVCTHCGSIFIPSINCDVEAFSRAKLSQFLTSRRPSLSPGKSSRKRARRTIFSSDLVYLEGSSKPNKNWTEMMVYRCKVCKYATVFDSYGFHAAAIEKGLPLKSSSKQAITLADKDAHVILEATAGAEKPTKVDEKRMLPPLSTKKPITASQEAKRKAAKLAAILKRTNTASSSSVQPQLNLSDFLNKLA